MIELPATPAPRSASPALIDFGGFAVPPLGGRVQRVSRLGSRFRLAVEMPPMTAANGRVFVRRLISGKSEGVRMEYPLLDFAPAPLGGAAPYVNGGGQSGSTLNVAGLPAGYPFREGQPVSHGHASGRCLYFVRADVTASGSGTVALPITPMLRVPPAHGDAVEIAQPKIEGFIAGEEWGWSMAVERLIGIEFAIEEYE